MIVLGIGGFMHDYNCCLIDTQLNGVAMTEAERLSRIKHHPPREGQDLMVPIRQVCDNLGISPRKIDVVVFAHTDTFACKNGLRSLLPRAEFVEVDHHLCHAAGAFFASGFDEALIVSLDGFGDGSSGLIATGKGSCIDVRTRISDSDSIGLEYLRATYHIGLGGYGAEGKTQGLAPYGQPVYFDAYLKQIAISQDGALALKGGLAGQSSALAVEGGYLNTQILTNAFLDSLGMRRIDPEPLEDIHMNLAASVQMFLEHVGLELCKRGAEMTGLHDLVLGGGVCMNSSLNGALLRSGLFRRMFALPMASDRGIGLGAALYYVHQSLGLPRFFKLEHVFYGGQYDNKRALKAARRAGLPAMQLVDPFKPAAEALANGKIIGWMRGRSELGARALGHRSILADPRQAQMKDIINARVKHREMFRPFAPAVLAERASEYFVVPETEGDFSTMTFTLNSRQAAHDHAPATVHVDGTARVQFVDQARNPDFHRLISSFAELTGVPILLNTSFNGAGEPIVETPEDALRTFLSADMDLLFIGDVMITKS
ncbi:putative Nodulation protein NolNO [Rhodospirillaceae bacterium LM-1]|nr:putative Nodulation protein NolNO [Rhodospirillaceae bacterium LM-1]